MKKLKTKERTYLSIKRFKIIFLTITIALFTLTSCGGKNDSKQASKLVQNEHDVCDLLNKKLIKELYPSATNFNYEFSKETYPTCKYKFDVNGKSKQAKITAAFGHGSLKSFDKAMDISMKYLSGAEVVKNVGQKAYYFTKIRQLSAWEGKNVIHVNVGNDREKTIIATRAIFKKLK